MRPNVEPIITCFICDRTILYYIYTNAELEPNCYKGLASTSHLLSLLTAVMDFP